VELFRLYARLALHNVGRIDWQPYLEIIFTRSAPCKTNADKMF
jgi:hypothetical protein